MNKLKEAQSGGIGVPQQTGYGKNWHTQHPEPINERHKNFMIECTLRSKG